jgi:hypothetical protein
MPLGISNMNVQVAPVIVGVRHGTGGSSSTTGDGDCHTIGILGRIQDGRCSQGAQLNVVDAGVAGLVQEEEDLVLALAKESERANGTIRLNR